MTGEHTAITIRDAVLEDAPAIDAVLRALGWFTHLDDIPADETQARIARVIVDKCSPGADNTLLVAESDEQRVVGYLFVHWLPNLIFGGEGYVSELFVREHFRGQGIGSQLLDSVQAEAQKRGCSRLMLLNQRKRESYQRRFYQKQGWEERPEMANFVLPLNPMK